VNNCPIGENISPNLVTLNSQPTGSTAADVSDSDAVAASGSLWASSRLSLDIEADFEAAASSVAAEAISDFSGSEKRFRFCKKKKFFCLPRNGIA
jgi:hypothetical protein